MKNLRKVAVVGRMNVGKSTLFNRLSTSVKSITLDYPGVTRDVLSDVVTWKGYTFELIDTGGISLKKSQDKIDEAVRQRALDIVKKADLILFVVDGKAGLTLEELEIVKVLRTIDRPVILVVNKMDSKLAQEQLHEFDKLAYKSPHAVSAQHGQGITELVEDIIAQLQDFEPTDEQPEPKFKVVLLGKPNVGKSSLMNLLAKHERSLVTDVPGTTRESIEQPISFYKETISLVDTAGVRRKRGVKEELEQLMVKSTMRSVKDADVVLLLVDASEGRLSDQELKLAFYAFEQGKALIILFNKSDLVNEEILARMKHNLDEYRFFIKKVAHLDISCKSSKNIGKILPLVLQIWQRHSQKFDRQELVELFKTALIRREHFHKTIRLEVRSVEQIKSAPITIVLYVNHPQWFGPSQLSFFENVLRKKYNLVGVPVRLVPHKKGEKK